MLYPSSSPYHLTGIVNNQFLDIMVDRPLPKKADDLYWEITPTYNLRPDLLAYDLYGNHKLWWVFIQRNLDVLQDPIYDFTPGTTIYLPKKSNLERFLGV